MRRLLFVATAAVLATLAACFPATVSHDKAYYAAHGDERASELTTCQTDPGRLGGAPNCVNAQAAESDAHAGRFYDAPKTAPRVADPGKL